MKSLALLLAIVVAVFVAPPCKSVAFEYALQPLPQQQGQCPTLQDRQRVRNQITAQLQQILSAPVHSCNGSPGWRRVAFLNMTEPSEDCPPGLSIIPAPIRTCGQPSTTINNCSSAFFPVSGQVYRQVCGRIKAYQLGPTGAFNRYVTLNQAFDESYVDGLSLTHGSAGERHHIWTFAAGFAEITPSTLLSRSCPCDTSNATSSPPFVGDDYFCESGSNFGGSQAVTFFSSDPLWDGEGCSSRSTCCQFNNPPWFTKNLPAPTRDDIELRLCNYDNAFATVPIEQIELYIQ